MQKHYNVKDSVNEDTKTDKLSREERKQLNQINKEIEDSLFYK